MAAGDTDIGTGTTLTVGASITLTAELMGVTKGPMARGFEDVSHMGTTGARKKIPHDTFDPGNWTFECNFKENELPDFDDSSTAATITVTLPGGSTWAASAFPTEFSADIPWEAKMTSSYTYEISEGITVA